MSDPIENKAENLSCSLPDYPVDGVNASVDPSLSSVSPAPLASFSPNRSDHPLSSSYSSPEPLSLHTLVAVGNPSQFGGRRKLSLQDLLSEASTNPAAQDEIIELVASRAGDPGVTGMCYVASENTLGNILSQLMSDDGVARNEGRLALEQYILGHSDSPHDALQMRLGVLATVARICQRHPQNREAKDLLVNVYRQTPHDSPLGRGIDQLSNRAVILQAVGQNNVASRADAGGSFALATGAALGASAFPDASTVLTHAGPTFAILSQLSPSDLKLSQETATRIATTSERLLGGTHLEGIPSEEIVATAQRFLGEAADRFRDDLRRGILGLGMRHTDFGGNFFLAHSNLATRVADRIASIVFDNVGTASGRDIHRSLAASGGGSSDGVPTLGGGLAPAPAPIVARGTAQPVVIAKAPEMSGSFPTTGQPQTINLAGMQGASSQNGVLGFGPNGTAGNGYTSRLSYAIEGPGSEEAPHGGFSGSSQQHDGNPDQDQPEQPPADSFIA